MTDQLMRAITFALHTLDENGFTEHALLLRTALDVERASEAKDCTAINETVAGAAALKDRLAEVQADLESHRASAAAPLNPPSETAHD